MKTISDHQTQIQPHFSRVYHLQARNELLQQT